MQALEAAKEEREEHPRALVVPKTETPGKQRSS
jgi:hypothetical protein